MVPKSRKQQWLLTLALGLAGLVINYVPIRLLTGVDILLGGVVAIVPAILLGPWFGALAMFLSSIPTAELWAHPYAMLTFTMEGLVVGWLITRRHQRAIESALLFWLCAGLPLILLCHYIIMQMPFGTVLLIFVKQALTGLSCVAVGSMGLVVASGCQNRPVDPRKTVPLRSYLTKALVLMALTPILISVAWYASWLSGHIEEEGFREAAHHGRNATSRLQVWSRAAFRQVEAVAGIAVGVFDEPEKIQRRFLTLNSLLSDFDSVYIGDQNGTALVFWPEFTLGGEATRGRSYADREYFVRARLVSQPFLSNLVEGRVHAGKLITAVVFPIRDGDQFRGFVAAGVPATRFTEFLDLADSPARTVVVTDAAGRVVVSTSKRWKPSDPFALDQVGEVTLYDAGHARVLPRDGSMVTRYRNGHYTWSSREARTGWTVTVLVPIAPYVSQVERALAGVFGVALLFVFGAAYVSRQMNRRIVAPLEALAAVARQQFQTDDNLRWPEPGVLREVNDLTFTLVQASSRMRQTMLLLLQTGAQLQERNQTLAELNARLELAAHTDVLTGFGNHRRFQERIIEHVGQQAPFALVMIDLDNFKSVNDHGGHLAGDQMLRSVTAVIRSVLAGTVAEPFRYGGDEFTLLLPGGNATEGAVLAERLVAAVAELPYAVTLSAGVAAFPVHGATCEEVLGAADAALYRAKHSGKSQVQVAGSLTEALVTAFDQGTELGAIEVVKPLLAAIHAKDAQLGAHALRLAVNARQVGEMIGMPHRELQQLELGALLHDIGKLEIPRQILTKPERLSDSEYALVKMHPVWGAEIVSSIKVLGDVASVVRHHHERYDGKGYPDGLAGGEIPLGARVTAVCDALDAMLDQRPYQRPLTVEEARAELLKHAGTQFDPFVVQHVVHLLDAGRLHFPGALEQTA